LAANRAFAPDVVEKVARLCRLLSDIHIHPYLGPRLALKGGTALNLFYLDVPRLSVDLDFNYIGAVDAKTMAEERPSLRVALLALSPICDNKPQPYFHL
jgi:predicted nucleotidyltransferase component of viral defense system